MLWWRENPRKHGAAPSLHEHCIRYIATVTLLIRVPDHTDAGQH